MSGNNAHTARFMSTLPHGPLLHHIAALHEMAYWGGIYGSALSVFEHHLHAVAVESADRYQVQPERRMNERFPETAVPFTDIGKAMREATAGMAQSLADMRERLASPRPKSEWISNIRYERRIQEERTVGLAHVKSEARRVRRELGL